MPVSLPESRGFDKWGSPPPCRCYLELRLTKNRSYASYPQGRVPREADDGSRTRDLRPSGSTAAGGRRHIGRARTPGPKGGSDLSQNDSSEVGLASEVRRVAAPTAPRLRGPRPAQRRCPTIRPYRAVAACLEGCERQITRITHLHELHAVVGEDIEQAAPPAAHSVVAAINAFALDDTYARDELNVFVRQGQIGVEGHAGSRRQRLGKSIPRSPATSPTPTARRLRGPLGLRWRQNRGLATG
jgi:hypothetical protein